MIWNLIKHFYYAKLEHQNQESVICCCNSKADNGFKNNKFKRYYKSKRPSGTNVKYQRRKRKHKAEKEAILTHQQLQISHHRNQILCCNNTTHFF